MSDGWSKATHQDSCWFRPLVGTYQAISSASVDALWKKIENLADVSWHPLIASTNVPKGLLPKPGLIYRAVTRLIPIPIRIFVERVLPKELISVRILALPGVEERVTYRVESTVWGTRVSYSVTLRGWLSPLVWSLIRPYAAKVAAELAHAAERDALEATTQPSKIRRAQYPDLLGSLIVVSCVGQLLSSSLLFQ
jgi:hypothetical protein